MTEQSIDPTTATAEALPPDALTFAGKDEADASTSRSKTRVRRKRSLGGESSGSDDSRTRRRRRSTVRSRHIATSAEKPVMTQLLSAAFFGLLMLVLFGPYMTYNYDVAGGGQLVRQVGYVSVALGAAYAVRGYRYRDRVMTVPTALVLALGWCAISLVWSIEPSIAVRRFVLLAITVWSTFVMVRNLGWTTVLNAVRLALVGMMFLNYVAVFIDPVHAIHQVGAGDDDALAGDWFGVMGHKNQAGLVSAMTILFFAFERGRWPRLVQAAIVAAAAVFMWYSGSKTSLGVTLIALAVASVFSFYRYQYRGLATGAMIALALALFGLQNFYIPLLETMFSGPITFTGRTKIWDVLWRYWLDNPVLGAGYGSFWNIGPSGPVYRYGENWVTNVTEGHNGYLDLLATLGPIGLLLVIGGAFIAPVLRLLQWRHREKQAGALLMAVMIFYIGHNFTESSLFDRDSIGQVFLMIAIAAIWTVNPKARDAESGGLDLFSWANRDDDEGERPRVRARRRSRTAQPA